MGITSRTGEPMITWDAQLGYTNYLVPGSPEHSGAHARLLELAVEMESDFEPYGKRSRVGMDCADCSWGVGTLLSLPERLGQIGESA
jgi:hypothetical protein